DREIPPIIDKSSAAINPVAVVAGRKAALELAEGKPPTIPVNPDGIPADLRHVPRWVCWRWERRKTWTKPPIAPKTGRKAKSNDSSTWATFDEAYAYYREHGCDGIGFMLADDMNIVGLDLDDARDPATGIIAAWAEELLREFGGYAEASPS